MLSVPCISLPISQFPGSIATSVSAMLSSGPMSHDPALCPRNFHKFVFHGLLGYVRRYQDKKSPDKNPPCQKPPGQKPPRKKHSFQKFYNFCFQNELWKRNLNLVFSSKIHKAWVYNKKRSHTQLDSRKQVIAFQDRVITINIKEAQHPLK